jgi:hypothetical protein
MLFLAPPRCRWPGLSLALLTIGALTACATGDSIDDGLGALPGDPYGGAGGQAGAGGATIASGGFVGGTGGFAGTATGGAGIAPTGGSAGVSGACPDPGEKQCGGICVPPSPQVGCSLADCTPCPTVTNGVATCSGEVCSALCDPGYVAFGASCVDADGGWPGLDAGGEGGWGDCSAIECGTEEVCYQGACCTPATCGADRCGAQSDGCGGVLDCSMGNCGAQQVCSAGLCCTPDTCDDHVGACGAISDGCGGFIQCGGSCGPTFRVTEYQTSSSSTAWNLTLNQALVPNYLVIVQGSRSGNDPEDNYVRVNQDPFATGALAVSAGPSVLRLTRADNSGTWSGVVKVVESLRDHEGAGFRLLDVRTVSPGATSAAGVQSGTVTAAAAWSDLGRTMLVGGVNGAGCTVGSSLARNHYACHFNLFPSGTDTINWQRVRPAGNNIAAATTTVMVVQWGSEWTVQRTAVTGSASGAGANDVAHYNTAAINEVPRAATWVWGTGYAYLSGSENEGRSAEGSIVTLGNGVNVNSAESVVAVGQQTGVTAKAFTVYALTHPSLVVDYRFRASGTGSSAAIPTNSAAGCSDRMAMTYNGLVGTSTNWVRAIFRSRYSNDTTITMTRPSADGSFAAWAQGIQFCNFITFEN